MQAIRLRVSGVEGFRLQGFEGRGFSSSGCWLRGFQSSGFWAVKGLSLQGFGGVEGR